MVEGNKESISMTRGFGYSAQRVGFNIVQTRAVRCTDPKVELQGRVEHQLEPFESVEVFCCASLQRGNCLSIVGQNSYVTATE